MFQTAYLLTAYFPVHKEFSELNIKKIQSRDKQKTGTHVLVKGLRGKQVHRIMFKIISHQGTVN